MQWLSGLKIAPKYDKVAVIVVTTAYDNGPVQLLSGLKIEPMFHAVAVIMVRCNGSMARK